jgi:tape measure domain-containing protein
MARYTIDFTTNASRIIREIEEVNRKVAQVARTGKSVKITLDAAPLQADLNATFRQLDKQIENMQRKLSRLQIGSGAFRSTAASLGFREGQRERGQLAAEPLRLRGQAQSFDEASLVRLNKELQAARIEASQLAPNTAPWIDLQRQIGQINSQLKATDRLAESIQMQESLGAFAPGSLNALEAKLIVLRNRAREIAPDTTEWKQLNKEIVSVEGGIEKQTRRPLTGGQRLGAAGGAFLYGGGLGGGVGSAVGGIAGGLMGGVPGAFAGAAFGQLADNLGTMAAGVTNTAATIQQLQRGLALASIDAADFAEAQKAIAESSNTLVVPIERVYRQFTQLRVNTKQYGLSVQETQQILEGVVLAVSSVGGSMEDVDGAMRAVVQIFSKGSVQAEELRGQLGERFPGAVVKFAQANKMSFDELQGALEQGKVTVGDFVDFAKKNYEDYAKFSERLATGPEFAGRRLEKAMNDMQIAIGSALGPAGAVFQDFFAETISGFSNWANQNKEFIAQYLRDWAVLATDFARIVGSILKVAVQVSTAITRAFSGAIREIRRLLGMVGVAEIKAELDKVNAQIAAGQTGGRRRGAAQSPLETRRQQLQAQFAAAGGQAALDAASAPGGKDFTFGGPGAGMSLDAAGGKGKKAKKAKELKDFAEDETKVLRERLALQKTLVDAQSDLTSSQKELAKAELDYEYGLDIVEAQYQAAIKTLGEYKEAQRGTAQASMQNAAVLARENVTAEYRKALLGDLIGRSDTFENKTNELKDSIAALTVGQENLSESEKIEAQIKRETTGLTEKQLKIVGPYIEKLRQQAQAVQVLSEEEARLKENLEKTKNLREAQTGLGLIGGGLQAGFTGEASSVFEQAMARYGDRDYATQLANVETTAMQLRSVFEGLQGAIQGVSSAFANVLTEGIVNMISGTATAKEVFANFLQSVGQSLSQAASQMISTYIAIGIAKMFAGLGGGGGADMSKFGITEGTLAPMRQYTDAAGNMAPNFAGFANGGIASGGFRAFANGGVVSGPTLGLVGEGKYNEAIVPLPDGKSIPVQMRGQSSRDLLSDNARQQSSSPVLSMSFQTTKFGDREYVDVAQLQAAMAETRKMAARDGANRGASLALDKLQNSPSARRKVGMR